MGDLIFSIHSWPRAILHIDGDAFFTSCEEAIHPELRGKPLVTGGERGIVACASYAAKERGVERGVPLGEAKRRCSDLIVLPSDYETYSLFSRRLFNILRRFTPQVEEYSIDEAFADLTGLQRPLKASYEGICRQIKQTIYEELGITVSMGLSLTKVLAKVASKHKKPDGMTIIPGRAISAYLKNLPIEKVWGIGPATTAYLHKMGIFTALDFARLPEEVVKKRLTKPGVEIWRELRGESVNPVITEEKSTYASISKTKTFAPPTSSSDYLLAQLFRNLESACLKARDYHLSPRGLFLFLKTENFHLAGCELKLNRPSSYPLELSPLVRESFFKLYRPDTLYRATGVVLMDLFSCFPLQYSLFDEVTKAEKIRLLYEAADKINRRFGKHTLHLGVSHLLEVCGKGKRGEPTCREKTLLFGENRRQHLGLPLWHIEV